MPRGFNGPELPPVNDKKQVPRPFGARDDSSALVFGNEMGGMVIAHAASVGPTQHCA